MCKNPAVHDFPFFLKYLALFAVAATTGFWLLARAKRLALSVKPDWLRRNLVTFLIGLCFFFAIGHLIPDFRNIMHHFGPLYGTLLCCAVVVADVLIPYNIVLYITEGKRFSGMGFVKQQVFIFFGIVLSTIVANGFLNYWINGNTNYLRYSVGWSFYMAAFGSLVYLLIRQNESEKAKKLFAKELEVAKLSQLKTKAELETLQAKINPHFLYNALNAIADLSVTDGAKGRQMSLGLADLFRYSINYGGRSLATVKDEVQMAEIYLGIEKIRFEDRLRYSIEAGEESLNRGLPRFLLQPLIENAVKHGLKNRDETFIEVKIKAEGKSLRICVFDNGPAFPDEPTAGYGLQSIFDKLDLLYPGNFEVQLHNAPHKHIEVVINKGGKA